MFFRAATVQKNQQGIDLFDEKGKKVDDLEVMRNHLFFRTTDLFVRSSLDWDFFEGSILDKQAHGRKRETPNPPTIQTSVTGNAAPGKDRIYAFKGQDFLGQIQEFTIRCVQSEDPLPLHGRVWAPDDENELAFYMDCRLPESLFREIFHPLWVRQANTSALQFTVELNSYQSGPEASFGSPGSASNIVLEAGVDLALRLVSISLVTGIQEAPPSK